MQASHFRAPVRSLSGGHRSGVATVEFALVSFIFFFMVFATIDFGRAIFVYSELHHAVRDATREVKTETANGNAGGGISQGRLQNRVRRALNPETNAESARPGLGSATVSYSCSGGCSTGNQLTAVASVPFVSITQDLLGIGSLTLTASSTVTLE